jgi:hypothetical protein
MLNRALMMVVLAAVAVSSASASDWPAFHGDSQRSGYTSKAVTGELKLAWSLEMPHAPTPAWSRNGRIRCDDVFQPVVAGGIVLVPDTSSSCKCSYFNQCWLALQPAQPSVATKRPNMPR